MCVKLDKALQGARSQVPAVDCTKKAKELAGCERSIVRLERHKRWTEYNNPYLKSLEEISVGESCRAPF